MQAHNQDSTRILRLAAWIWISYLLAMAVMDVILYTQVKLPVNNLNQPPLVQNRQPIPPPGVPLMPVFIYYAANAFVALSFLVAVYWDWIQKVFRRAFYPLLLLAISAVPIIINVLVVPRFPNGPLANSEGMALRQLPVLFLGLALVAWQYESLQVILYSIGTTALELGLVSPITIRNQGVVVLIFVAIIRTISFIALGIFISLIVTRLRKQQESLQQANANLSHYASTLEQLTVSRERNRMSRELHDTVVHTLSGLAVQLETTRAYLDIDPKTAGVLLVQSLESTRSGLQETRRAIKELRASPLDDLGLIKALQKVTQIAAQRGKLALDVSLPDQGLFLSPDVEQCIYRITQEAVENVVHHAQARHLTVHLEVKEKDIELLVQDDGMGFNPDARLPSGHFGITAMRERAQMAGGELSLTSQPNGGTTIRLEIKGGVQ